MTALALRLSAWRNGVSRLHGDVSRRMWQLLWSGVPEEEVPIGYVTNGIHAESFISSDLAGLFDRYLGADWRSEVGGEGVWGRVNTIPAAELWRTHERRRRGLSLWRGSSCAGSARSAGRARQTWLAPTKSSTPKPSPSASDDASPPTSAPR